MGTKLKSILRRKAVKVTAFILCAVVAASAVVTAYKLVVVADENGYNAESLIVSDYLDSQEFYYKLESYIWRIVEQPTVSAIVTTYHSEILDDYYITDGDNEMTWNYTGRDYFRFLDNYCIYEDGQWSFSNAALRNIEILPTVQERLEGFSVYLSFNEWFLYDSEFKDRSLQFNQMLEGLLDTFEENTSIVEPEPELSISLSDEFLLYYYSSDGVTERANVAGGDKSSFSRYAEGNHSIYYENGVWSAGGNTDERFILNTYYYDVSTIYAAFSADYLEQTQKDWSEGRAAMMPYAVAILCLILAFLLLFVLLIFVTGRKPNDPGLHLSPLEKVHSDILLAAFAGLITLWVAALVGVADIMYFRNAYYTHTLAPTAIAISTFLISACSLSVFLALARKVKSKILIKHSITYIVLRAVFKFFYKIYDALKSLFDGRAYTKFPLTKSLFIRQLVFICASAPLMLFTILFAAVDAPGGCFILLALELVITAWYLVGSRKTYGDINKGFSESVEEQLKAERMKAELVTNVSHDIKTPLTSVISYVDLLSKEEGLSDAARDYVTILAEKSDRLKNIVSDLFDLSKSTSGDISLEMETLDLKKLIEQTLADMRDAVDASGLVFKTNLPDEPVNIVADGKKLYRVFQNVIDNTIKYSLDGSRVFVGLEVRDGHAVATVKNTSAYEIGFSADDVLQRFTRGDKARATEGSGLGLSIAESFTKVCGGDFKISIDGDLFKVTITLTLTD